MERFESANVWTSDQFKLISTAMMQLKTDCENESVAVSTNIKTIKYFVENFTRFIKECENTLMKNFVSCTDFDSFSIEISDLAVKHGRFGISSRDLETSINL